MSQVIFFALQLSTQGKLSPTTSEGSVELSHADQFSILEYHKNALCPLSEIDATKNEVYKMQRRLEKFLNAAEVSWLSEVYCLLYPKYEIIHVPMIYDEFREVTVLGVRYISKKCRENTFLLYTHNGLQLVEIYHQHVINYKLELYNTLLGTEYCSSHHKARKKYK